MPLSRFDDDVYTDVASRDLTFDDEQDDLLLDRYVVLDEAGSGAFGSVVLAWDTRIRRKVAIKCMPLEGSESLPLEGESVLVGDRSFDASDVAGLEEARTAAMLSDAAIVSVYDFEVSSSMAYLILEYVDGMTLADVLKSYSDQMNADIVAYVFKTVAHALMVAHKHHVLHLDIKPENVLIDHQGQVKVTDFGLARLATESGYGIATGGTIGYMPPEQMTGQELDERCDEWALASLTYEMISGNNPFIVDHLNDAEDAIYDAELVVPSLCMERIDNDIDDILFCALDPDYRERYDSIEDFAQQLQPCLGSTRKGKNALRRLVDESGLSGEEDPTAEDDDYEEQSHDLHSYENGAIFPARWAMSERMRTFCMRTWAVLEALILLIIGIDSLFGTGSWLDQPVVWAILTVGIVLTALLPHVGAFMIAEAFGVSLCACGAPLPGIALMALTVPWWYCSARHSVEGTNVGLSATLFGAVGLSPLVPFVAGFLLSARDSIISTLYSALVALLLAGLGSASILGWDPASYIGSGITSNVNVVLLNMLAMPSTWVVILSWVLACVASSMLCGLGKKSWSIVGMIFSGSFLIAGLIVGSLLDTSGAQLLQDPLQLAPVIGALALALILASVAVPARTQNQID